MNSKQDIQPLSNADALPNEKEAESDTTPVSKTELSGLLTYQRIKPLFDFTAAFFTLVILSPVLAVIAVMIRLDSPGSPVFRQERVGKDGRKFILYKFRSMYKNNDDSKYKAFITRYIREKVVSPLDENGQDIYERVHDPRVTRLGRVFRKTNLDELPQLFNILKGDMSFVGPRPDITFAVDMYDESARKRLMVKPGLTGLWQASGRKKLYFEEMIKLDMDYIKRQSLLLDIMIVILTARAVLKGEGS